MARRLGVTRQHVIDAALLVVDQVGLADLTVAAVATAVGCRPPSVYHHVDGLDGLVAAIAEAAALQLSADLTAAADGADATAALGAMARACVGWARSHPGRFDASVHPGGARPQPGLDAARRAVVTPVRDTLRRAGVPDADVSRWTTALVAAVRGTVDVDRSAPPATAEDRPAPDMLLVDLVLDALPVRVVG